MALFGDFFGVFSADAVPRQGGKQFNDYRGTLVRINGRWRIKELIATPTKVIV